MQIVKCEQRRCWCLALWCLGVSHFSASLSLSLVSTWMDLVVENAHPRGRRAQLSHTLLSHIYTRSLDLFVSDCSVTVCCSCRDAASCISLSLHHAASPTFLRLLCYFGHQVPLFKKIKNYCLNFCESLLRRIFFVVW